MRFFPKGLKNEFETAEVNESLVFEPLKFYCIWINPIALRRAKTLQSLALLSAKGLKVNGYTFKGTNSAIFNSTCLGDNSQLKNLLLSKQI